MTEILNRLGPAETISGENVRVFCMSDVYRGIHAGAYVVNEDTWQLNAATYTNDEHTCRAAERGCKAVTQLRALHTALHQTASGSTLALMTAHQDVILSIKRWQIGFLEHPLWFRPIGMHGAWMPELAQRIADEPALVTPHRVVHTALPRSNQMLRKVTEAVSIKDLKSREEYISNYAIPLLRKIKF
jgi:hypothetical protein